MNSSSGDNVAATPEQAVTGNVDYGELVQDSGGHNGVPEYQDEGMEGTEEQSEGLEAKDAEEECYHNPELPPELVELLNVDNVGDTMYSKHWILKTLMNLMQLVTDTKERNIIRSALDDGYIDLDESLQDDLCKLWDMSMNPDVVAFLTEYNAVGLMTSFILNSAAPRANEICMGIIGNMACQREVRKEISANREFIDLALYLLQLRDRPTLIETMRLITTCVWDAETSPQWLTAVNEPSNCVFDSISDILQRSINEELLHKTMSMLLALFAKDSELCRQWSSKEFVSILVEAMKWSISSPDSKSWKIFLYVFQEIYSSPEGLQALASYSPEISAEIYAYLLFICKDDIMDLEGRETVIALSITVLSEIFFEWDDHREVLATECGLLGGLMKILEALYPKFEKLPHKFSYAARDYYNSVKHGKSTSSTDDNSNSDLHLGTPTFYTVRGKTTLVESTLDQAGLVAGQTNTSQSEPTSDQASLVAGQTRAIQTESSSNQITGDSHERSAQSSKYESNRFSINVPDEHITSVLLDYFSKSNLSRNSSAEDDKSSGDMVSKQDTPWGLKSSSSSNKVTKDTVERNIERQNRERYGHSTAKNLIRERFAVMIEKSSYMIARGTNRRPKLNLASFEQTTGNTVIGSRNYDSLLLKRERIKCMQSEPSNLNQVANGAAECAVQSGRTENDDAATPSLESDTAALIVAQIVHRKVDELHQSTGARSAQLASAASTEVDYAELTGKRLSGIVEEETHSEYFAESQAPTSELVVREDQEKEKTDPDEEERKCKDEATEGLFDAIQRALVLIIEALHEIPVFEDEDSEGDSKLSISENDAEDDDAKVAGNDAVMVTEDDFVKITGVHSGDAADDAGKKNEGHTESIAKSIGGYTAMGDARNDDDDESDFSSVVKEGDAKDYASCDDSDHIMGDVKDNAISDDNDHFMGDVRDDAMGDDSDHLMGDAHNDAWGDDGDISGSDGSDQKLTDAPISLIHLEHNHSSDRVKLMLICLSSESPRSIELLSEMAQMFVLPRLSKIIKQTVIPLGDFVLV